MTKIGLLSDTHDYLDDAVFKHFEYCDEIWHAGDFGTAKIADALKTFKPLRGVYGNIDGQDIRTMFPETLVWDCEQVTIVMTHIGGYPPKYNPHSKPLIIQHNPQLFISGHSHILKVIYDPKYQLLHINPGAAGNKGFHQVCTAVRFVVDGKNIRDMEVLEFERDVFQEG